MAIDPISEALSNTESGQVLQQALGSVGAQSPDQQREEQNVVPAQLEEGEDFQELIERVGGDVDATIERLASTQLRNFSTENVQRLVETGEINDILQQGLTATGGPEFEIVNPQADQVQSELEQQGGPSQSQQTQQTTTQDRPSPQPQGQQVQPSQTQGQTAEPIEDMGAGGTNLGRNISQQFTVDTFSLQDAVQDEQTRRRVNELEQQAQQTIQQVTQDDEDEPDGSGFRDGLFSVLRTGIELIGMAADPETFISIREMQRKQQQADRAGDAIQAQSRIVDVINEQGIQDPQQRVRTGAEMLANAGLDPQNHRQFLRTLSNNPEEADKVNQVQKARTLVQEFLVKSDNVSNETQFNALRDNLVGQIQQFDNLTEQQQNEIISSVEGVQFGETQEEEDEEPLTDLAPIQTLQNVLSDTTGEDRLNRLLGTIEGRIDGMDISDERKQSAKDLASSLVESQIQNQKDDPEERPDREDIIRQTRLNVQNMPQAQRESFIESEKQIVRSRDDLSDDMKNQITSQLDDLKEPTEDEQEDELPVALQNLEELSTDLSTGRQPSRGEVSGFMNRFDASSDDIQQQFLERFGANNRSDLQETLLLEVDEDADEEEGMSGNRRAIDSTDIANRTYGDPTQAPDRQQASQIDQVLFQSFPRASGEPEAQQSLQRIKNNMSPSYSEIREYVSFGEDIPDMEDRGQAVTDSFRAYVQHFRTDPNVDLIDRATNNNLPRRVDQGTVNSAYFIEKKSQAPDAVTFVQNVADDGEIDLGNPIVQRVFLDKMFQFGDFRDFESSLSDDQWNLFRDNFLGELDRLNRQGEGTPTKIREAINSAKNSITLDDQQETFWERWFE